MRRSLIASWQMLQTVPQRTLLGHSAKNEQMIQRESLEEFPSEYKPINPKGLYVAVSKRVETLHWGGLNAAAASNKPLCEEAYSLRLA